MVVTCVSHLHEVGYLYRSIQTLTEFFLFCVPFFALFFVLFFVGLLFVKFGGVFAFRLLGKRKKNVPKCRGKDFPEARLQGTPEKGKKDA